MTIGTKIVSRLKRFVEGLKQRGEIQRLKDEIADAHAFIFMIGAATTDDDMKGTLDEQIEWLRERLTRQAAYISVLEANLASPTVATRLRETHEID